MGIIDRRMREKRRRVDEIVEAAKRIFNVKGFAASTMNDIADSSELSRRTLYMYFKSKEELSLAVAASALRYLDDAFKQHEAGPGSAFDRLDRMLSIYRHLAADDPGRFQFLVAFVDSAAVDSDGNESFLECKAALSSIVSRVASAIRAGVADGSIKARGDPDRVAASVVFTIHSVVGSSFTYRAALPQLLGAPMDAIIEDAISIVHSYLLPASLNS